jgi:hypothetical protein
MPESPHNDINRTNQAKFFLAMQKQGCTSNLTIPLQAYYKKASPSTATTVDFGVVITIVFPIQILDHDFETISVHMP